MKSKKNSFISFRFAEVDDAKEIASLLNQSYQIEYGSGPFAYKKGENITTEEKILSSIDQCPSDDFWYIAETFDSKEQEEYIIAVANCSMKDLCGNVKLFAVSKSHQNCDIGVGTRFLSAVEYVMKSNQCITLSFSTTEWRTDIIAFAKKRGYKEYGGGLWIDEVQFALTKPTRYITYRKIFNNQDKQSNILMEDEMDKTETSSNLMQEALMGLNSRIDQLSSIETHLNNISLDSSIAVESDKELEGLVGKLYHLLKDESERSHLIQNHQNN